ncbi:MAG: hypothetical protein U1E81_18045 [Xanthobacteraceae bacterium]
MARLRRDQIEHEPAQIALSERATGATRTARPARAAKSAPEHVLVRKTAMGRPTAPAGEHLAAARVQMVGVVVGSVAGFSTRPAAAARKTPAEPGAHQPRKRPSFRIALPIERSFARIVRARPAVAMAVVVAMMVAVAGKPAAPMPAPLLPVGVGKIKSDHISSFLRYIDTQHIAQCLAFCKYDISKKYL